MHRKLTYFTGKWTARVSGTATTILFYLSIQIRCKNWINWFSPYLAGFVHRLRLYPNSQQLLHLGGARLRYSEGSFSLAPRGGLIASWSSTASSQPSTTVKTPIFRSTRVRRDWRFYNWLLDAHSCSFSLAKIATWCIYIRDPLINWLNAWLDGVFSLELVQFRSFLID